MIKLRKNKPSNTASPGSSSASTTKKFMDHVHELRSRLTWIVLWFILVTGAVFPFYHDIIQLLMKPLGDEKLYYLTPIGGVSFAIKVCMYVGMVATFPVFVYHLYKFISPIMKNQSNRKALLYVTLSTLLAAAGIVFAYLVSLPSALKFLTNFNIGNVSAMLTVDSYMSFIIAYVVASALMFQIPLIMVIIDKITPMPPSRWNKYQRHMIVAAFVIAMFISPSPEITTQVTLAVPILVMYQLGIGLVWFNHRKHSSVVAVTNTDEPIDLEMELVADVVSPRTDQQAEVAVLPSRALVHQAPGKVDVVLRYRPVTHARNAPISVPARPSTTAQPQMSSRLSPKVTSRVTIDGFFRASSL